MWKLRTTALTVLRRIGFLLALLWLAMLSIETHAIEPAGLMRNFPQSQLLLITGRNCIVFDVRVADTDTRRARGLMYVQSMRPYEGMVFIYGRPGVVAMWMKNTYIPLDMLFAAEDGRIVHVHRGAVPHDTRIISSVYPVIYVIELNAGRVDALDIKVGNRIRFPAG